MYLTIRNDQNLSVHDGETRRMFGQGVHEISDEMAATIEAMNLKWARVTVTRPAPVTGQADTGPLTPEALQYGTEGAKTKKLREVLAEAARVAAAEAEAEKPVPDPVDNFTCADGECDAAFPTVAALERHVEMNHVEQPVDEDDPGQGVEVPAEEF